MNRALNAITYFVSVKLPNSDEEVDGQSKSIDLDTVPLSLSCTNIDQREPKVDLNVITNGPALIGEWFKIHVHLTNKENVEVKKVSIVASLEEANDPIIADTTRLTLDYK